MKSEPKHSALTLVEKTVGVVGKFIIAKQAKKTIQKLILPNVEGYAVDFMIDIAMTVIAVLLKQTKIGEKLGATVTELYTEVKSVKQVQHAQKYITDASDKISEAIHNNVIKNENFLSQLTTRNENRPKESSWVAYCTSMMIMSIVSAYVLVVLSHLMQTIDSSCIDAFVSWTMSGKLNIQNVNLGYSKYAKLNGARILACIDSIKRLRLPISIDVIDLVATLLGSLGFLKERTPVSIGIGIALNGIGPQKNESQKSFRLVAKVITGIPKVMQLVILAQKMLYIQTKVLEDAATVRLGPQLFWKPGGLEGRDDDCSSDFDTWLQKCIQHRQKNGFCEGSDPGKCDKGKFPCKRGDGVVVKGENC